MNREIKFRFWDKKLKKFCYCSPLEAHSVCLPKLLQTVNPVNGEIISPRHNKDEPYATSTKQFFDNNQDDFVIQQCTGYIDIYGKEIYEGDLVQTSKLELGSIVYGRYLDNNAMGHCGFYIRFGPNRYKGMDGSLTICGHIFDNQNEFDRELIYEKYMKKIKKISEDCEDKTYFTPQECCNLVIDTIEELDNIGVKK